jgi:hypothetical protein
LILRSTIGTQEELGVFEIMKKHLIVAGLFALGLGSLATSAWIGFARPSTAGPNAGHLQALPVSYRLPNYTGFYSTDVCSGQNLMNPNQRARACGQYLGRLRCLG